MGHLASLRMREILQGDGELSGTSWGNLQIGREGRGGEGRMEDRGGEEGGGRRGEERGGEEEG